MRRRRAGRPAGTGIPRRSAPGKEEPDAAYRARDYEAVLRAARVLEAADQPETMRLLGADWRERVHWKRTGGLLR